ncbi:MAG: porin family protein [Caulobacteraceae bacterium]|nr:porin family protein [Caulobacteraceae bacterium]
MKKILLAAAAVAAVAFVAAPASAQDQEVRVYGTIGVNILGDSDVTLGEAQARIGFRGEHFGVEAEGGIGITDDSIGGVNIDLDHQYAGYLVGYFPVSENTEFFGRIGYGTFQVSALGGSGDANTTNIGVGLQYNMDEHNGFRADYTYMAGDGNAYMAGVSYVRTF